MNKLEADVEQMWPGFTKIFADVASKVALSLLYAYPAPAQLLAAPKEEVLTLIMAKSRRSKDYAERKYKTLRQCAKEALVFGV